MYILIPPKQNYAIVTDLKLGRNATVYSYVRN